MTKRIMLKLMSKAFEGLDNIFAQDKHKNFEIINKLLMDAEIGIRLDDPICSIIDDVIKERIEDKKFYSEEIILNKVGTAIEIDQNGIEDIRIFLSRVYEDKGTFLNLIEFSLLKFFC
jgi:hypothetical protein